MRRQLLSAFLALFMVLTLLPVSAMAESTEVKWGVAAEDGTKPVEWAGSGTLQDVVTYANGLSRGTAYIQLQSNVTAATTATFTQGTTILDLNGGTLSGSSSSGVITLSGGTLTIDDSSAGGNGKVTSAAGADDIGTINVSGGNLVVAGGTVENLKNGEFVHTIAVSSGNVTVNGGKVSREKESSSSYTINNTGSGTVTVNGGEVSGGINTIVNTSGTVNVTGGKVINDKLTVVFNQGTMSITGGLVQNTSQSSFVICNIGSGSVHIGGSGEVRGCIPIFLPQGSTGTVSVTGGKVIADGTDSYAIESQGKGSISVSGGELIGKSCAIRCSEYSTANVSVTGGVLTSENSSTTAGTVYLTGGWLTINGGTIENTNTSNTGYAIYVSSNVNIKIISKSPVIIKSTGTALNQIPSMGNTFVKTAATDVNGTVGVEPYDSKNVANYKYLEFVPTVAATGGKSYATLQEAVDAVAQDATITLFKNTQENVSITRNNSFVLELNSYTLDGGTGVAIKNNGSANLTISDKTGSGLVTGSTGIDSKGTGEIIVLGGRIISNGGCAIRGGTVTLRGGRVENTNSADQEAIVSDQIKIETSSSSFLIIASSYQAMSQAPTLPSNTASYVWRSREVGAFAVGPYVWDSSHTFVWICTGYTVTYHPGENGAGSQAAGAKAHGDSLKLPGAVFTREGYKQTGWATTEGGEQAFALGGSYTANAAIDLYPVWTPNTYTVTYHPGANGTGSQVANSKTHDIDLTLRDAVFTREGYTQTGWATTDGGTKAYELGGSYTANTAITLYPAWTPDTYVVTYHPGTNGTGSQATDSKTHDVALKLGGAIFTREGYTQTGWATTDGGTKAYELGGSYTANTAITLYPAWTPDTYVVTYHPGTNGTGSQATDSKTHDVALKLGGAIFTREGYTQTGWATTDGGTQAYELGGSYTANEAITLYPIWTHNTYAVTYRPGANGTGSQTSDSKTYGIDLKLSGAVFTREGYTQSGWATTDGGTQAYELDGSYTANADITLYPVWTLNTYAVTYRPGTNGTGSQATDSKTHGVALTLSGAMFTREGYTQTGWAATDGGAQAYALNDSYTANTAINLYPVWTPDTYVVTYHPGTNGTGSQATDSKTHDVALKLGGAIFTREGYTQTGWATTDGGTKAFALGGSYTANAATDLYPVWTQNAPNTYTVSLPTGTGYTVTAQDGSSSPVTEGGSFSFTVAITGGYHKGSSFAVKANGASLTANGSGVYTISSITQAQTVTVEGVEQDSPAPTPSPTSAPPADTVYNDPSKDDATVWLTGSGFASDDLLMTQALSAGSDYNAMLKLADGNDVLLVYEISLQSGTKSTGSPMFLTFDLTEQYAGQALTLVHKKADGTFEYLYATAGADGKVTFGPLYELSPFMLVKGTLSDASDEIPKTDDDSSTWIIWLLCGLAAAGIASLIVLNKRKKAHSKYKA